MVERSVPPDPGWTAFVPANQPLRPGPVAIACHTRSGVASTSASVTVCQSPDISELLRVGDGCIGLETRMNRDDDAVIAPTFGRLVVVSGDQRRHGLGQLFGERGAIGG